MNPIIRGLDRAQVEELAKKEWGRFVIDFFPEFTQFRAKRGQWIACKTEADMQEIRALKGLVSHGCRNDQG